MVSEVLGLPTERTKERPDLGPCFMFTVELMLLPCLKAEKASQGGTIRSSMAQPKQLWQYKNTVSIIGQMEEKEEYKICACKCTEIEKLPWDL